MKGKVVLITGASSGIGKATAKALASMRATLVLGCRDRSKAERARVEIMAEARDGASVEAICADLRSQKAIHGLVAQFKDRYDRLDVLINNAAIIPRRRTLTVDGIEEQLAVNHLAGFMLSNLLLDRLIAGSPSRIVNVSSGAHNMGNIRFDDIQAERSYGYLKQYSATKLMNVLFTYELADRLEDLGVEVTANCLHPGIIKTRLWRNWPGPIKWFLSNLVSSPEKGARTSVHLASSSDVEGVSGRYFAKMRERRSSKRSYIVEDRKRLWKVSEELTGVKGPWKDE